MSWDEAIRAGMAIEEDHEGHLLSALAVVDGAAAHRAQRGVVAALYWRAGVYAWESERPKQSIHMEARMRGAAFAMERAARDAEALLAPPPVPQIQRPPASADSQQQGDDGEDGLGEV
jgi:hypothetical protein